MMSQAILSQQRSENTFFLKLFAVKMLRKQRRWETAIGTGFVLYVFRSQSRKDLRLRFTDFHSVGFCGGGFSGLPATEQCLDNRCPLQLQCPSAG